MTDIVVYSVIPSFLSLSLSVQSAEENCSGSSELKIIIVLHLMDIAH